MIVGMIVAVVVVAIVVVTLVVGVIRVDFFDCGRHLKRRR